MTRKFIRAQDYVPVLKFSEERYRINFDFVPYDEDDNYGWCSSVDYFGKPTTEQIQDDVVNGTIQRYEWDKLDPPTREQIDLTEYTIE